jgi:HD-like signal output (HDOD) protein
MPAPLSAPQTLERAQTLMQSGRGAALPELLRVIETLSVNTCEVTISDLSELIEKDAIVLAKILSVANTLVHNPGIARLESLSQAIHQLGYNRIRTIAVSLMLINTAGGENSPPEQREAATRALCSGLIAQGAAEWLGTHDPEFAFACAALRDFGRIMFAAISPTLCRAATLRAKVVGDAAAHREKFGFTPLGFSQQLLASAKLPETVLASLRDCEPESLRAVASTFDNRLLGIADFGARVANLVLDTSRPAEEFIAQLAQLNQRFEFLVPGAADLVRPALQRADDRIRTFASNLTVRPPATLKLDRLRWRLAQLSPATPADASPADTVRPPTPLPAALDVVPVPPASPVAIAATPPPDDPPWDFPLTHSAAFEFQADAPAPTDSLRDALTGVGTALGVEECWWFEHQPAHERFTLALGTGPAAARLPAPIALQSAERSVFGVCLSRREVVLIHDTADANLRPYLPPWFRQAERPPAAFALIPLPGPAAPAGLLFLGWSSARRITLSLPQIALAHQLLAPALASRHPFAA